MHEPFTQGNTYISAKNQVAMLLYVTRVYGKCEIYL